MPCMTQLSFAAGNVVIMGEHQLSSQQCKLALY